MAPNLVEVTLTDEEPSAGASFGDGAVGSIGGVVFGDVNGDGVQGVEEKGIGGVVITLRTAQGQQVASRTTSSDGVYLFGHVEPGSYELVQENPAGLVSTTIDLVLVDLTAGGSARVNFGERGSMLFLPLVDHVRQ